MSTNATQRPWSVMTHYCGDRLTSDVSGHPYSVIINNECGSWPEDTIAEVWGENNDDEANAELIVRAVNCFDELVEAVEVLLRCVDADLPGFSFWPEWPEMRAKIDAALARAKGEAR